MLFSPHSTIESLQPRSDIRAWSAPFVQSPARPMSMGCSRRACADITAMLGWSNSARQRPRRRKRHHTRLTSSTMIVLGKIGRGLLQHDLLAPPDQKFLIQSLLPVFLQINPRSDDVFLAHRLDGCDLRLLRQLNHRVWHKLVAGSLQDSGEERRKLLPGTRGAALLGLRLALL